MPLPGQPHLFLLSVPVGLPGLPHRYLPLDPVDLHFPSDRSLPALPCHLSAPAGLPDQHHLPVPVRRLPRQGRCHRALPYHPSAQPDLLAPCPLYLLSDREHHLLLQPLLPLFSLHLPHPLPLSPLSGWQPSFHHHCPLRCLTAQFPSVPSLHQPHLQRCLPDLALHEVPEVRSLLVRLSDLQDQVHLGGQSPHAHLVLPSVPVVRLLLVRL
ncbi:Uncharacterised protein [Escherichia coli]|nr:Uncharacterised protein [Escherichia coli]